MCKSEGVSFIDTPSDEERLREEAGRRTVVVVGIVDPVRVEFELAVVEVEVQRVVELIIGVRINCFCSSMSPDLEIYYLLRDLYSLNLVFYPVASVFCRTHTKQKQAVSPQHNALIKTLIFMTLVVLVERESLATAIREPLFISLDS